MPEKRSENSYINNDVLPFLASDFDYPIHDADRVKINDVPIFRPSGGRAGSIDVVYYHNGEPVLLVEAKARHKSHEAALKEALVYLKNFPSDKPEFAPSRKPPKFIATTVGKDIKFYKVEINISKGYVEYEAEHIEILSFKKLLEYYGYIPKYTPRLLIAENFKADFLDELIDTYVAPDRKITRDVILNVSNQILNFLAFEDKFSGQLPYINLDSLKQKAVRDLFNRFNLKNSLGPEIAKEYRKSTLRAFQGGGFNQFMTEQCIIDFMFDLAGRISPKTKVLDFECGSGGFLAAAIAKDIPMSQIQGVDIDELPYIVAKTHLALYSKSKGRQKIDSIPVIRDDGLFYYGSNWDLVISNPAGGNQYKHGNEKRILKEGLQNLTKKSHIFSEYELSIQQAIRSVKVGGVICLILPEGFYSNSNDSFLRKFVAKHCRVLAIISLPRGIFRVGTSVKGKGGGSHVGQMKMSILYAKKIKEIELDFEADKENEKWNYPIFMASVSKLKNADEIICDWLEKELNLALYQWKLWGKKKIYKIN